MSNFNINNLNRDYTFKTEQYFRRGWEIFRQNIWEFIIFSLSIIVIVNIFASKIAVLIAVFVGFILFHTVFSDANSNSVFH